MANEISVTVSLALDNGESSHSVSKTYKADQSAKSLLDHVQTIGTSEEAITLGDTGAGGFCYLENLDSANYVSIRQGTATTNMVRLKAGEAHVLRWDAATTAPYAIADTAAVRLRVVIYEA